MARPILDPLAAQDANWPEISFRVLNQNIRAFGYVPDDTALLPGDVLLVTGHGLAGRWIAQAQRRGGFADDHCQWTHAALYVGSGRVIEATPSGGVRIGLMVETCFNRRLLVRRRTADDIRLEHRYQIVIEALTALRRGYSLGVVPSMAWQAFRQTLWQPTSQRRNTLVRICSTVVGNAYSTAINLNLLPGQPGGVVWPADLSHSKELTDIQIGWLKVSEITTA